MADKPKRKAKSVLGTLPAKRPERLGTPRAKPAPKRRAAAAKPRPVRPAAPPLRARRAAEPPPQPLGAPKGTELVTTTIRAAGELAQIGFTVGGRVLKRAVDRIPRP
ncbi:MAG TPA: hypothetical protein VFG79_11045 [Solirubrobacter sp.]|nr:hypothetical protein [Solirubrobacter sp.]